jgi:hypothetical protein
MVGKINLVHNYSHRQKFLIIEFSRRCKWLEKDNTSYLNLFRVDLIAM